MPQNLLYDIMCPWGNLPLNRFSLLFISIALAVGTTMCTHSVNKHTKVSHGGQPEGQLNQGRWARCMNLSYIYASVRASYCIHILLLIINLIAYF